VRSSKQVLATTKWTGGLVRTTFAFNKKAGMSNMSFPKLLLHAVYRTVTTHALRRELNLYQELKQIRQQVSLSRTFTSSSAKVHLCMYTCVKVRTPRR